MGERCCICGTARRLVFCAECRHVIETVFSGWSSAMCAHWAAIVARRAERRRQKARRDG